MCNVALSSMDKNSKGMKTPKQRKCLMCPTMFVPTRPLQVHCSFTCAYAHARAKESEAKERNVQKRPVKASSPVREHPTFVKNREALKLDVIKGHVVFQTSYYRWQHITLYSGQRNQTTRTYMTRQICSYCVRAVTHGSIKVRVTVTRS